MGPYHFNQFLINFVVNIPYSQNSQTNFTGMLLPKGRDTFFFSEHTYYVLTKLETYLNGVCSANFHEDLGSVKGGSEACPEN